MMVFLVYNIHIMSKIYSKSVGLFALLLAPSLASANIDLTHIPLGDGHVSTSTPQMGYIYSCTAPSGIGAGTATSGPWIASSTWDSTQKVKVMGANSWSNARLSVGRDGGWRVIQGNDLPVIGTTGNFPIATSDPAYLYNQNPNFVTAQNISVSIPMNPIATTSALCVNMGPIGITFDGVLLFNGLDAMGRDAVAHEVQDSCSGHPEVSGKYHHHGKSQCTPGANSPETLIGYAFDGFGVTSGIKSDGSHYVNADLDVCHGTTSPIVWDGYTRTMYHYVMTDEYPYSVGCFRGTIGTRGNDEGDHQGIGTGTPRELPFESAISACNLASTTAPLSRGSRGTFVTMLQSWLTSFGFLHMATGTMPGFFGPATENALRQYQSNNGISPAGVFGPRMREHMSKMCPPGIMKQIERGRIPPGLIRGDDRLRWNMGTTSTSTMMRPRGWQEDGEGNSRGGQPGRQY